MRSPAAPHTLNRNVTPRGVFDTDTQRREYPATEQNVRVVATCERALTYGGKMSLGRFNDDVAFTEYASGGIVPVATMDGPAVITTLAAGRLAASSAAVSTNS